MSYLIENDVPVRGRVTTRDNMSELTQTLSALEIGQSFVVHDRTKGTVRRAVNLTQKRLDRRYSTRTQVDAVHGDVLRVWRIA
jgi:hypothetical protein